MRAPPARSASSLQELTRSVCLRCVALRCGGGGGGAGFVCGGARLRTQRTFREILFLQELGDHENIIKLLNVLKADNDKDIYLVFEFMGESRACVRAWVVRLCVRLCVCAAFVLTVWSFARTETDLHAVIRANILEDIHKQYIMYVPICVFCVRACVRACVCLTCRRAGTNCSSR